MTEQIKNRESQEFAEKKYPVRRICSWCNKDLGFSNMMSNREGDITHGMCDDCAKKFMADEKKEKKE